ncbi:MAG: prepilin-type N-terminal cleavage/methylation domain-containing protein [Patescibacteria group bacterium]|nr:prepilin-type N-terminal cleavage/methylation domain-containing protein [Patescibacteria group bacterium]
MKKLMPKLKGFTIIEVIIVLVIGAVIMLAVFLVVPQLQVNARNNQRRNDIQRVLVAARQYYTTNKFIDLNDALNPGVGAADAVNIKNIISSTFQDPSLSATGNGIRTYEIKPRTGGRGGVVTWIDILKNTKCRANQMTSFTATDLIPSEGSIAVTLDVEPLTATLNADGNYRGKSYYCVSD